jgi:hypothetical protein
LNRLRSQGKLLGAGSKTLRHFEHFRLWNEAEIWPDRDYVPRREWPADTRQDVNLSMQRPIANLPLRNRVCFVNAVLRSVQQDAAKA